VDQVPSTPSLCGIFSSAKDQLDAAIGVCGTDQFSLGVPTIGAWRVMFPTLSATASATQLVIAKEKDTVNDRNIMKRPNGQSRRI
jgi:hypothetical protein